jgi:hypothetical protein
MNTQLHGDVVFSCVIYYFTDETMVIFSRKHFPFLWNFILYANPVTTIIKQYREFYVKYHKIYENPVNGNE